MSYSSRLVVVQTETRAGDISLLSPTVSGLQDMLKICDYADKYKIHFNASKSQLLCFNTSTCTKSKDIKVYMRDGSVISYLDTCTHLGNILCTSDKHVMIQCCKRFEL